MNTTKLELPDGRFVTIEGSNAADVGNYIINQLGLKPTTPNVGSGAQEVLGLPTMSSIVNGDYKTAASESEPVRNVPAQNQEALAVPDIFKQ